MPNRRNTSHTTENNHLPAWMLEELRPDVLLKSASAGVLIYLLEIMLVSSFAALVFSDSLADLLPAGIGFVIAGNALLSGVVALASTYRGSLAVAQDAPSAVTAAGVAALAAALPAGTGPDAQFATVLLAIVGTTLVSACLFLLLGLLRLGGLVRFLPYPVMGGFLAGTGWLLATGAVGVMTGTSLGGDLLAPSLLVRWLPGALVGILLFLMANRWQVPWLLPLGVGGALALFYLAAWLTHTPVAALRADGWLLGPFSAGGMWRFPMEGAFLAQANWQVIAEHWPQVASAAPISLIALLLNVSGLELVVHEDMDPNRELVSAGLGNLGAALAGGLAGYHAISLSTLNHKVTGGKRLPGLFVALLMTLTVFMGASVLNYVPKLILGALLFFVGLSLLMDWVYHAWFRFPKIDFAVIVFILGVIAVQGFLAGVVVGLVLTILIFVVNYSQIRVIKHALTGKYYRSRVTRDRLEQAILDTRGDEIYILKLQGYVFFGTANSLLEQIRARLSQPELLSPCFIILDLGQVTGIDSTGLLSFEHLLQILEGRQITLIITGASTTMRQQFEKASLSPQTGALEFYTDLDHAVEESENAIIASTRREPLPNESCQEYQKGLWPPDLPVERLTRHMDKCELAAGEYLIHQGDEPDLLFLVESGEVTAQLEVPGQQSVRLETMRGGRSVGEIGFYLGIKRTATVLANEPSTVYSLSRRSLDRLEHIDPEAASVLHHLIAHLLAERVAHLTRVVGALER